MPFSTEELRARLANQLWTAHNIRLSDEIMTLPGQHDTLATDLRLHAIRRVLRVLFPTGVANLRFADLGCLEGGFSLAFALDGAKVIGLDARKANLEKAQLLKEHFELPNLEFIQDDVKNFTLEKYGSFDVVMALGILYHLNEPMTFLRQVAAATQGVLFVESHVAPAPEADLSRLDTRIASLSPIQELEVDGLTVEGRWFDEFPPGTDPEPQLWSSYSNSSSFWLTRKTLVHALVRYGFDVVWEAHDLTADQYDYFTHTFSRALYVAVKTSNFPLPPNHA